MSEYSREEVFANLGKDIEKRKGKMITWVMQNAIDEKEMRDKLARTESALRKCEEKLQASQLVTEKLTKCLREHCPAMAPYEYVEEPPVCSCNLIKFTQ